MDSDGAAVNSAPFNKHDFYQTHPHVLAQSFDKCHCHPMNDSNIRSLKTNLCEMEWLVLAE